MSQVITGKGFEYGLAKQLQQQAKAELEQNQYLTTAKSYFSQCSKEEQNKITAAARKIITFLLENDHRLTHSSCKLRMQSDQSGVYGDVRDIIVETPSDEIGVSAKNRNFAVKNPRLSAKIDFGEKWLGHKVSEKYWEAVRPVFNELSELKNKQLKWREFIDKQEKVYTPLLDAFDDELMRIYEIDKLNVAEKLLHYLLGIYDFYKVTKINGKVKIQSFNINGTLKWGTKLPMPKNIEYQRRKNTTTSVYSFDKGWQISFRIHNAETLVTPSLKFDVQIVGMPQKLSVHEITYK